MAKKKTAAELRAENQLLRAHGIGNNITKVIRDFIMWGAALGIAYFAYLSIDTLAGKTTKADIEVKAEGALSMNAKPAAKSDASDIPVYYKTALFLLLLFGVGGIAYGRREAKLRRDVIERYHPVIQVAEKDIDPKRSSSQLTSQGDTRPEDI